MENSEKIAYIHDLLTQNRLKLALGESITGGEISKMITDLPGASDYYRGGITAYTNIAKKKLLKVSSAKLKHYTAYDSRIAKDMALGARKVFGAHISLGITGLAGPNRDNAPSGVNVGTVFIAVALNNHHLIEKRLDLSGDRNEIRTQAADQAIDLLYRALIDNKEFVLRLYKRMKKRII